MYTLVYEDNRVAQSRIGQSVETRTNTFLERAFEMERVARNYSKMMKGGECSFEAQNVTNCSDEGGSKKECARYVGQFKRCLLSEWCPPETMALQRCIDKGRARMTRKDLVDECTAEASDLDRCMAPRMSAMEK